MARYKSQVTAVLCFLYFMCVAFVCTFRGQNYFTPHFNHGRYMLFKDESSILQYFEEQRAKYPVEIDTVLKAYHECFFAADIPRSTGLRRPFIVVEGKNRQMRETLARMLADTLGGKYLAGLPKCMVYMVKIFPKSSLVRNAFFALALYPNAFNARQILSLGTPVVMNGYWTEQASYVIDKLYQRTRDLPPAGGRIYDHPRDLMMPDILFYIKPKPRPEIDIFTTKSPMWRPKMVHIYSSFRSIPVVLIDTSEGSQKAVDNMYDKMRITLGDNFDFSPAVPYDMPEI